MPTTKPVASYTYTDQELLDLWREALAVVSIKGQSYEIEGRTFTHFDLNEIRKTVDYYETRVAAASGISVNLARMK